MKNCDTLLTARWVVTQDRERRILENAGVAVVDGRIEAVADAEILEARYTATARIDLGPALLMPGLVNSHTHAAMSIFRGVADDLPLMQWLTEDIWPVEKSLTPEIVHKASLLACAEMIATGTTLFSDMYLIEGETARAVDETGMRAVLGEGIFAFPSPAYADPAQVWELVEKLHHEVAGNERISTSVTPHAVYTTTPEILTRSFGMAEELGDIWMTHLGENSQETADCVKAQGMRPVAYLDSLGCLAPRTVLFHGVDLDAAELDLLAVRGVSLVHNPKSNLKLANGVAPVTATIEAGVNVALGTDGAASNNSLNMFTEMTTAALMQKGKLHDPTALKAQTVLDMATRNGAEALGFPDLGRLAPGSPADLIALDLTRPNLQPLYRPESHLVYAANGGEVCLNMVAGEIIYRDGKFSRFDYPALLEEVRELRRWVLKTKNQAAGA